MAIIEFDLITRELKVAEDSGHIAGVNRRCSKYNDARPEAFGLLNKGRFALRRD
jgi:hypothetical protein